MAEPDGSPPDPVALFAELERDAQSFDFHAALRRIECAFRDRPRLGTALRPEDEPLRLGQDPSLSFAPAELSSFLQFEGRPARLAVEFLGLFGPSGALPLHFTEFARDRLRNAGDATFARFVDTFHHRLLLLFHRAWATTRPTAQHDRPLEDRFKLYLGAISGLGPPNGSNRAFPEHLRWYYAGLFATANRSAEGLCSLIADYFDVPARVEEFITEWATLPESSRFRLNGSEDTSSLGRTAVLGARVRLCQGRFRVVLGPLSGAAFERFLPRGENLAPLLAIVRTYSGDELSWDVRLVPAADVTDQLRLGEHGRLGWNTRIGHRRVHLQELIIDPSSGQTHRAASPNEYGKA